MSSRNHRAVARRRVYRPVASPPPPPVYTSVRVYPSDAAFLRHCQQMRAAGWEVQSCQVERTRRSGFAFGFGWLGLLLMILTLGLLATPRERLVVTYVHVGEIVEASASEPVRITQAEADEHIFDESTAQHLIGVHGVDQEHIDRSRDLHFLHTNAHWREPKQA